MAFLERSPFNFGTPILALDLFGKRLYNKGTSSEERVNTMPKFEAMDREGFTLFEPNMLLRVVRGLEVDWMEGYGNTPDLKLNLDDGPHDYFQEVRGDDGIGYRMYEELPLVGGNIYYADHPMGWVKYFTHSGKENVNGGGFGGAKFGVQLPRQDAQGRMSKVLQGPWSSRATVVNMAVDHHPDLSIMDVHAAHNYAHIGALKEIAVKALLEHFEFPYYIVRQIAPGKEKNSYSPSTQPDGIIKPSGQRCQDYKDGLGYDIFWSPK